MVSERTATTNSIPSSHLSDIKFVAVEGGATPTLENSIPLEPGDESGRGSLVYFNQASMHQSAETGFATIGDAKLAGFSGKTDYGKDAQAAFDKYGTYLPAGH